MAKEKVEIVFEDEQLVIVNKPPHVLSIPDRFSPEKPNLQHMLTEKYGKIWTVHRLDKETSGIICFAKNEDAHRHLSLQFSDRQVEKYYLALVDGHPSPEQDIIDKPIAKHPHKGGQMTIHHSGKPALSEYELVEKFRHFSLLKVQIKTGRTHQIRIHLKSIGHPLVVDSIYGKREALYLSEIKQRRFRLGKDQEERPLLSRIALHAFTLKITHPESGEVVQYEAEPPKDMRAVLQQLRKWATL